MLERGERIERMGRPFRFEFSHGCEPLQKRLDRLRLIERVARLSCEAVESLRATSAMCCGDLNEEWFQSRLDVARLLLDQARDAISPRDGCDQSR